MTAYDRAVAAARVGQARQWLADADPATLVTPQGDQAWRHIGRGGSIIEDLLAERAKLADRLELIKDSSGVSARRAEELAEVVAELREGS